MRNMTSYSSDAAESKLPNLSPAEIDELLSMTLIANLATVDDDGGIHLLYSSSPHVVHTDGERHMHPDLPLYTHKYRNLRARPHASVMIGVSKPGLNLKGVLIRGQVELVEGEEGQRINRCIHLKYVTPDALSDPSIASYLSKGDDVTVKVHMDHLISWNLSDSTAGRALSAGGWFHTLDG
jgi:hypothetical protein